MRPFDDLLKIDGDHTVSVRSNGSIEIVPATRVYTWRRGERAPAWPLHEERGQTSGEPPIREHEAPPLLDADTAANTQWNASDYEAAVHSQLERVFRRPRGSGARLRRLLGSEVTIMPFPIRDPVNLAGDYRPNAAPRARASDRSLYIVYTPGHFLRRFRASALFHELVHVYRITEGVYRARMPARDRFRYTMWEEFPAVCIENIFRSEHALPLRWGHYDLTRVLSNPDTWLDNIHNRRAVDRLIREMPALTGSLAEVNTAFNPFRQLIHRQRGRAPAPKSYAALRVPGPLGQNIEQTA